MRWKLLCGGVALVLAVAGGCKQRCFVTAEEFNAVQTSCSLHLETKPDLACQPLIQSLGAPPTLYDLDRKIRFLSLAEAVSTALERGRVGQPSLLFPGTAQDNLVRFTGGGTTGSDAIRVLALDPARNGAEVERQLARFDAFFAGSIAWNTTDTPIGTPIQSFQAQQGVNAIQTQSALGIVGLFKPLPSGGVAGITFNTPYQFTNLTSRVNPAYQPQLQFAFDQPLLQGFGVEINQLREQHPFLGAGAFGTNVGPTFSLAGAGRQFQPGGEGILITRLRFDQSRADFEANVNQMLLNVETAYWNLYGAYWALYSREQGLRFAFETYRQTKANAEAGRKTPADVYQAQGQYELFRAQRLQSIDTVLDNERQLRALMGLQVEDGTRLMPSDSPTLALYKPDYETAWQEAMARRPELYLARQDVKAAQLNLIRQKNLLLPDLRFQATYDFNSIGSRLDGPDANNAFRNLSDGNFSNWSAGLQYTMPLGFRVANAQVRQAQLQLSRSLEVLRDQEIKAESFLALQYRRMASAYEQIRAQRALREAQAEQLKSRNQEVQAGRITLNILLEAQRFWAEALQNEYAAIVQYNNALAGFEFAKGTILQHDNVVIAEGELPECARARAVEHFRQRTAALVLGERAVPLKPACPAPGCAPAIGDKGGSLPALYQSVPPLKDVSVSPDTPPVEANVDELFAAPPPAPPAPRKPPSNTFGTLRRPGDAEGGPPATLPQAP